MEVKVRELKEKEIIELAEKTDEVEARYFLRLSYDNWYNFYNNFEVILGEVKELKMSTKRQGNYETIEYLLVPQTMPVIVLEKGYDQHSEWITAHVFTQSGWKKIQII